VRRLDRAGVTVRIAYLIAPEKDARLKRTLIRKACKGASEAKLRLLRFPVKNFRAGKPPEQIILILRQAAATAARASEQLLQLGPLEGKPSAKLLKNFIQVQHDLQKVPPKDARPVRRGR
jgi:hypothetical protein